ncbi:MAG: hypothetical protein JRJ87_05765, partial [Deltaproteobacteria bacterium]|nr:hypothetical protein [Deltaproteobacteria bacterium]
MLLRNLMLLTFLPFIATVSACSLSPDECRNLGAKPLPAITKAGSGYVFQHELNSDILACAEKLGEKLRLQVHVRAADRKGKVADQIITRPEIQVLFSRNQRLEIHQRETTLGCMERYESYKIGFGMCGRISAEQVWIKLQGTGALAHFAATSPRLEPDCPGRKPEPRFKLDGRKRVSLILKPGEETAIIRASTGKKSARCRYERCEIQVR